MVRTAAERAFVPARHVLEEFGDMMILTGKTIWSALRPPYPYGGELVSQFLFALRLCWFPLLVSTVCICYAAPGLQAANFLTIFGALDRLGRRRGRRTCGQRGRRARLHRDLLLRLRLYADAAGHAPADPGDQVNGLLAMPREWLAATGEIGKFTGKIVGDVYSLRVF